MAQHKYQQFIQWLETSRGERLTEIEKNLLSSCWKRIKGDCCVILGDPLQASLAEINTNQKTLVVTPYCERKRPSVSLLYADYNALPFLPDRIDAILLPHTLDFSNDPYQVLREVEIALRPEGYLMIIGFNPWSLWGLRHLFSKRKTAPWSGTFRSASRIKDWLRVLNFEMIYQSYAYYQLPISHRKQPTQLSRIEKMYKTCFPYLGAVYLIMARKKVFNVTPLRAKWMSLAPIVHHGVMEPVRRVISS